MDIKVEGKELHQLSARELRELDKQIKLALINLKKNGFRKYQVGDSPRRIHWPATAVKVKKSNWSAEGIIEEIGARTATVNLGAEKILATPRMLQKV